MRHKIEPLLERAAQTLAIAGGLVMLALTATTVISITGRALGVGPIPGDYELVEAGTAFAIFTFLPWCHLKRGHVTVDLFMSQFGPRVNAGIDIVANLLMSLAAALIAWRLWLGMLDKQAYHETSFVLQFPLWWAYAASMIGAVLFVIICLFSIWRSLDEFLARPPHSAVGEE